MRIDTLSNREYAELLEPIWEFLAPQGALTGKYDCIFVFGGADLKVPLRAAHLWLENVAPFVVATGGKGPYSVHFQDSEAKVFAARMVEAGVSPHSIVTEPFASNTGENVAMGMAAFRSLRNQPPKRIVAVSKPFIMRRCLATFANQYPAIEVCAAPPTGPALDFIDRSRADFANRLIDELERLNVYVAKGFISRVPIPAGVVEAANIVREHLEDES
ncbi:MAG: YdcF family protein [Actinomycetota bacterium]|nr:YdcF family protein [Actinomycetota bacterium]